MDTVLIRKIIVTDVKFQQKGYIYSFLNPVSYIDALKNKDLFLKFDGIFADGFLLCTAIRFLYGKKVTRYSFDMTSLAPQLFEYAEKNSKTIYIVASEQQYVEKAVENILQQYQNLHVVGYRNGYFADEKEKNREIQNICLINPDFLIVGMGVIKQEEFLVKAKELGFQGIGFTCGGFIHQTALGKTQYYPVWIDKMNLRFLYRFLKEKHTRKRYLKAAFFFPIVFLKEWIIGDRK